MGPLGKNPLSPDLSMDTSLPKIAIMKNYARMICDWLIAPRQV